MPEVIEIRKYADFLNSKFKNKIIKNIKILKGRYKTHGPFELYKELTDKLPMKVKEVKTKGKFLYMVLEDDYFIFSTLGLHGGWTWLKQAKDNVDINKEFITDNIKNFNFDKLLDYVDEDGLAGYYKTALNNLNVQFITEQGSMFYFDSLSFGTLKIIKGCQHLHKKLDSIGPDIMEESTTLEIFKKQLMKTKNLAKKIGIVLLNQKVISGIGNYLRADVLWMSRISPFRKVKDLCDLDIKRIYENSKILTWGDYDYKKGVKMNIIKKDTKIPSDYKRDFFVYYSKEDIYGNHVIKEELYEGNQKRFIYWVKELQI
jgi:formamidopyrimidine-DNA glycosylase